MNFIYRIWAKLRGPVSAAWFGDVGRDYFAFGEGKAAEDAAFDIGLRAEAACRSGGLAVATVGDLEKGYEMVDHEIAIQAAAPHGYPSHTSVPHDLRTCGVRLRRENLGAPGC